MARRSRTAEETVSLFPFLAVLLCTMGTLVVVFVLVAQKTSEFGAAPTPTFVESNSETTPKSNAAQKLDDEYAAALVRTNAATIDELRSETESLDWFRDELSGVQTRSRESLEAQRKRLADAEKAVADLLAETTVLRRKLDALQSEQIAESNENAVSLQEKIDALGSEIQRLQAEVEKRRAENADANAKRSYAIVPYQGKKGTFRQPIFIECNSRGVFLQPEGVPFEPSDFLLAKYPGNPFDSGLRAAAAQRLKTNGAKTANGESIEPYPLLIVRPGGAEYYYPAVAALASWGDVFGYELVADDDEIAYPEPDPILAQAVREQASLARSRLAVQLAEATSARRAAASFAGNRFENAGRNRNGNNGGNVEASLPNAALQARLGGQARIGAAGAKIADSASQPVATGAAVPTTSAGNASAGAFGGGLTDGFGRENGLPQLSPAQILAADTSPLPEYNGQFAQFLTNGGQERGGGTEDASRNGFPDSQNAANAAFIPNAVNVAETASVPASPNDANDANTNVPQNSTTPLLALLQTPQDATSASSNAVESSKIDARQALGNSTFAVGATGTSDVGTLADSSGSVESTNGSKSTRIQPVDRDAPTKRDDDVAYSNSQEQRQAIRLSDELRRPATAGLERGITVRCSASKLVFPKQPGLRVATSISLDGEKTVAAKETELLDALVLCVKSWGVAGRNMYWAPYLKVDVAPGGEARFNELSEFCRSQGLAIIRTKSNDSTN